MYNRGLFFLISFLFTVALQAQKVTLNFENAKLKEIFKSITEQTQLSFAYSPSVVNVNTTQSVHVDRVELHTALDILFSPSDIAYEIGANKIYLTPKTKPASKPLLPKNEKVGIYGTVSDMEGMPVFSANVIELGTYNGTTTDIEGNFHLEASPGASILVSYIGYQSQTVALHGQDTVVHITLDENYKMLSEVIITALGIKKREESLSYSVQKIDGLDITRANEFNLINSLAGKATNVQVNRTSSGLGSSSRVVIRGSRSTSKNNQPLYVIDGIPILNTSSEQAYSTIGGTANAGNRDGGDGISNLNPEDIESISVLKGASASALYGSNASNGVILINTKKGINGVNQVRFSTEAVFNRASMLPRFQNSYGQKGNTSWGEKSNLTAYDNVGDFFQLGTSYINSLVLTTGTKKSQTYFSYANTHSRGLIENSKLDKHNINLRENIGFFRNRLRVDANVNFITQTIQNKPVSGGYYMNPLVGLYTFPRGKDITPYREGFEVYNAERNMNVQNWYIEENDGFEQNPYWLTNRVLGNDRRDRAFAILSATFCANEWLAVQARGSFDYIHDRFKQKIYASTAPSLAGDNGRYIDMRFSEILTYGDVMLKIKKNIGSFNVQIDAGISIKDVLTTLLRYDSGIASLYYPNVFTIANIRMNSDAYIEEKNYREQNQSIFGSMVWGYKKILYLDFTARNEWSSTLAFTNSMHKGFFYPSIGLSWLLSNSFALPEWISFGKIRSSFGKVGNALTPTTSSINSIITAGGGVIESHAGSLYDLKPEMSTSIEAGTEWRFFKERMQLDLTFYKTNTKNQLFKLPTAAGDAPYKSYYVNSGNVENKGVELSLEVVPILQKDFIWRSYLNVSTNKNKILELNDELKEFTYTEEDISGNYRMLLRKGDSFGDIYGKTFQRDTEGNILYDENGLPTSNESNSLQKVGNCNPDFLLGWGNSFRYKGFSLYFLLDGHFGGEVLSHTQAELDQRGVSKITGIARDKGYVELEGHRIEDVEGFYKRVGGRNGVTEYYMYSATNIRLREFSIGYQLPDKIIDNLKVLESAQVSLSGRNLFFLYNRAPFDPDEALSTRNNNQGIDVFGMPSSRSYGVKLKVAF